MPFSQLDQDASTALATIREWGNAFVPINCVPSEVLSLIPIYISREGPVSRQFRVPPVAQNVHSTRRTVITIGSDNQKEQSLRENHAQVRERVRAGHHIHPSRSRKRLDAAFTSRSTLQDYQFRSQFSAGRSGVFQSRF